MSFELIIFFLFAATLVVSAIMVVTIQNPVYAALFLILAFFSSASTWILLDAEFLGVVLVLVYVGAVMVLFLFVIMMLDINIDPIKEGFTKYLPIGGLVAVAIASQMIIVFFSDAFKMNIPEHAASSVDNTEQIGEILYTKFVYPFEIAAVILVVAIIAAISLTLRRREGVKKQDIGKQVRTRRDDRVRIVKMDAEEKV